jgi:hypothetical protein
MIVGCAPVWRLQLTVRVADERNAGTNDPVRARLNNSNSTWLDYGRDDFERGDLFTYDLSLDGVDFRVDIDKIELSKSGSDGLCLEFVGLLVNGRHFFSRLFDDCRWLDSGRGRSPTLTIFSNELARSQQGYLQPQLNPPLTISRRETESRIESLVGNFIHGGLGAKVRWGYINGRAVEAARGGAQRLHVDLDLKATVYNPFADDLMVDVDFDVDLSCRRGVLSVTPSNAVVSISKESSWTDAVAGIARLFGYDFERLVQSELNDNVGGLVQQLDLGMPICPTITVENDADIVLDVPGL